MGRALDSQRELVSPELVLVDPELRMRLALEVARIELEAPLEPKPRRGRWLKLVAAGAVAYGILMPGAIALASRPVSPVSETVGLRDFTVSESIGLRDAKPAPAPEPTRPPDAIRRPFPH